MGELHPSRLAETVPDRKPATQNIFILCILSRPHGSPPQSEPKFRLQCIPMCHRQCVTGKRRTRGSQVGVHIRVKPLHVRRDAHARHHARVPRHAGLDLSEAGRRLCVHQPRLPQPNASSAYNRRLRAIEITRSCSPCYAQPPLHRVCVHQPCLPRTMSHAHKRRTPLAEPATAM